MSDRHASAGLRGTFVLRAESQDFPWPGPAEPGPPPPGRPPFPGVPAPGPVPPTRVWLDPHAGWQDSLSERLLEQRIVLASGVLDEAAAR